MAGSSLETGKIDLLEELLRFEFVRFLGHRLPCFYILVYVVSWELSNPQSRYVQRTFQSGQACKDD